MNPSGKITDFIDSQESWYMTSVFIKISGGNNVDWVL